MRKTTRRKDYIKKGLHKRNTTYYTEKKIYGKRQYKKKDYIKDRVGLYEKKYTEVGLNYINGELYREN